MPPMPPGPQEERDNAVVTTTPCFTKDPPDIENLLALNPRVTNYANAVPTVLTKKNKKHWKRNADKSEAVTSSCKYVYLDNVSKVAISLKFFKIIHSV